MARTKEQLRVELTKGLGLYGVERFQSHMRALIDERLKKEIKDRFGDWETTEWLAAREVLDVMQEEADWQLAHDNIEAALKAGDHAAVEIEMKLAQRFPEDVVKVLEQKVAAATPKAKRAKK